MEKKTLKDYPNLAPVLITDRTENEQKAMREKAGVASGIVRNRKRTIKEVMDTVLSLKLTNADDMKAVCEKHGIVDPELIDAMCIGMSMTAATNPQAFKEVYTIIGQKPVEKMAVANTSCELSPDELMSAFGMLDESED